jgi:prevent-host-death family protein
MSTWSISEAKAKLSEVVRLCQKEPQTITRRGVPVAEIISAAEYRRLGGKLPDAPKPGKPARKTRR